MPKVSVIIPTLNEERKIERAIAQFQALPGEWEIIVADGGSRDNTLPIVERFPEVRVVTGKGARATLLNRGAQVAAGEYLLFLHADVELPETAFAEIERILRRPHTSGGAFRTWTVQDRSISRLMGGLLHLADVRSQYTSLPYGDQGIFLRRDLFEKTGGFPDQALMEDLEFSRRLQHWGRIRRARSSVRVSGRRMETATLRYALYINLFPMLYRLGVSPDLLARLYHPIR